MTMAQLTLLSDVDIDMHSSEPKAKPLNSQKQASPADLMALGKLPVR